MAWPGETASDRYTSSVNNVFLVSTQLQSLPCKLTLLISYKTRCILDVGKLLSLSGKLMHTSRNIKKCRRQEIENSVKDETKSAPRNHVKISGYRSLFLANRHVLCSDTFSPL